jgi:molybdenum cofactor biosynthesis enzyme MoaA
MKIATFTVVVGNYACDAQCPFCVSKMTPRVETPLLQGVPKNFDVACRLAEKAGATTMLLTGKGEPTLDPQGVSTYLCASPVRFPLIELQTNGIKLATKPLASAVSVLSTWRKQGLTTVCVSAVDLSAARNREIYGEAYVLEELASRIHEADLSMRLTIMMVKGYVDSWEKVNEAIGFCRKHGIEQLTVRPIERPCSSENAGVAAWVDENRPDRDDLDMVEEELEDNGDRLLVLPHDGVVYDVDGQNVCLSNCLTARPEEGIENIRQLIYFSDGHVRYDWRYKGAIIL